MIAAIMTCFVGVFAATAMLVGLSSARSRNEERGYLRYARGERQVAYRGAANVRIVSTDDHYLHPERTRAVSVSNQPEVVASKPTA